MVKETERKFLVARPEWRSRAERTIPMLQFYVASARDRSVRVRISGDGAKLTLKFGTAAKTRDEFEYAIPVDQAREMEAFAVGRPIDKTRHHVRHLGRLFEVDEFHGALDGLVVAELETEEDVADTDLPAWLGREVTGDPAYLNASLATNGLPETVP